MNVARGLFGSAGGRGFSSRATFQPCGVRMASITGWSIVIWRTVRPVDIRSPTPYASSTRPTRTTRDVALHDGHVAQRHAVDEIALDRSDLEASFERRLGLPHRQAPQPFPEPRRLREDRRDDQQADQQHGHDRQGSQGPPSARHGQKACPTLKWMRQRRGSGSPLTSKPSTRVSW